MNGWGELEKGINTGNSSLPEEALWQLGPIFETFIVSLKVLMKLPDFPLICGKQTFFKEYVHCDGVKEVPAKTETHKMSEPVTQEEGTVYKQVLLNSSMLGVDNHMWGCQGNSGKEPAYQCRRHQRLQFSLWVGKISWRRAWQPTPVFLPGKSHGQRSLVGYSPWGCKESDMTEET